MHSTWLLAMCESHFDWRPRLDGMEAVTGAGGDEALRDNMAAVAIALGRTKVVGLAQVGRRAGPLHPMEGP